jgi:cell division protein FtsW
MRPRKLETRRRPEPRSAALQLGRKHRPDYWLLIWCAALLSIGLIVVYAISPALSSANHVSSGHYISKQLIAIGLGLVAFAITAQVPLSWWKQAYKPLLVIAGLATLMALILPVNPAYPAHRWVRLGSFSFQSVELVKFAVMLWLAGFLAKRLQEGNIKSTQLTLKPILYALVGVAAVVTVVQSDLGSTGVIIAMMAVMTFVAGLPMGRIALIVGVVAVGLILAVSATPYRRERLASFLHPEAHCQSTGYQACQALIAVGSGGIVGLGLGSSVQAYGYLPEAANDSIFAIYAEKFGLIGSLVLLAVFIAFFSRLKIIAERLPDDFSRLLVVGVLAWLSVQSLINIGAMIGLLPLKGITLPFISYGGTSVVFAAAAVGLAFQASRYSSQSAPRIVADSTKPSGRDYRDNTLRRASY